MALRFRTPKIEELPQTTSRQAPGFAWITTTTTGESQSTATANKKRARNATSGQTEQAREALSAKQQREIERRIRDLNSDNARAGEVTVPKSAGGQGGGGGGGGARPGKTTNTKKILASGKGFQHHVDDEEAEIALRGRGGGAGGGGGGGGGEGAAEKKKEQRASKTPLARRKPAQLLQRQSSAGRASPAPLAKAPDVSSVPVIDLEDDDGGDEALPPLPSRAEMDALLNAPPLTYNESRSAPPPADAPPPRTFCEICNYWGRLRCLRCGAKTCGSVRCGEVHDAETCAYKPYA
ncbi:hypothetical protein MBLNU230_g1342t1 [Neophaeotheca triangularis]